MSIDEAIAHAREKAKEIRENIIDGNNLEPYESYCNAMIERCAEEHEQIAERLEELKFLRQWKSDVMDEFCKYDCNSVEEAWHYGYNKAIEEDNSIKELDLDIPQHFTKEQSDWIKAYCIKRNIEFYNKALDDFVRFASDMPIVEEEDGEIRPMRLEEMAEQLKAGVKE